MSLLVTTLVALAFTVLVYIKTKFNYWTNLGVPNFEISYIYGNAKGLTKQFHTCDLTTKFYQRTKQLKEKYCGLYVFVRPLFLAVDLEIIKAILIKDFNTFPNRGIYFNEKDDPLSANIFNIENEPWRALRQKLSPTFTSGKIKMMFQTVNDVSLTLLDTLDKQIVETGNCVDIKDVLARFTTDVIGSVAFGLECNSLCDKSSKFYEIGTKILARPSSIFSRFFRSNFRELSRKLHIKLLHEDISNFYMSITKDTVEYRENNPHVKRQDFMNLLIEMKRQKALTIEQIAAQSFIFFLAGYETSSSTMTYCTYELAINRDIQARARDEVRKALKKHNNQFTYDAVNEMKYLEQCVDETLRKYPVVPVLQRCSTSAYKVPGSEVVLPKGQAVWIPVYSIHHDPDIYENPSEFIPERFLPENVEKRHPCAYLPFGEGNRFCIGARFGKLETMLGLARILNSYEFTLDESKTRIPLKISPNSLVLTSTEKVILRMKKIT